MDPKELIDMYALEEAIDYVIKGLELEPESDFAVTIHKLFHNKVNDNDLSMDEYMTLKEAFKNPPKQDTPPPSPFPWIKSEFVGEGWKKR